MLLDSDGDGVANGVELGNPNCVWTRGISNFDQFDFDIENILGCHAF